MAEQVIGSAALMRRLNAIGNPTLTSNLMRRLATAAVAEQKRLVPRRTGNLARTIHIGAVTATTAQTVASANYARFVEGGTAPHEITPNAAKALRWAASSAGRRLTGTPTKAAQRGGAGGLVFAKRVHHPGTKAHPYMVPGARAAVTKAGVADVITAAWNEAA